MRRESRRASVSRRHVRATANVIARHCEAITTKKIECMRVCSE